MQYDDLIGLIETQHPQEKRDQQNFCENFCGKSPKKKRREEYALMNEWMNRIETEEMKRKKDQMKELEFNKRERDIQTTNRKL